MMEKSSIYLFKVNGRSGVALSEDKAISVSLFKEGPAETMRFAIFRGEEPVWDSGVLPFAPESYFENLPLMPKSTYSVRAEIEGGSSREITLHTGFMGEEWVANWIEPVQLEGIRERDILFFEQFVPMPDHFGGHDRLRPAQELRKDFYFDKLPERAMLYCSAHGVYSLRLNGKPVSESRLAPENSPYESLIYYQLYDLRDFLKTGENRLEILLADGWWSGRIGLTGHSCQYGDRLGFIAQMEIECGGEKKLLCSDGSFLCRESHIKYSDLMMGEKWDLSASKGDFSQCILIDAPKNIFRLQCHEPVCVWESLEPKEIFRSPRGELIADFGECLAGVVSVSLQCPEGRELVFDHSETLDGEGNFFRNILGRNKDQQDKLVCGGGVSEFCPLFTYHGFRYLRIEGASEEEILSLRALKIGTPLDELGHFECSHEGLNRFQRNIKNSVRANMVSVPTDCPQREKAGWTGDIQVFAPTGCFNYDLSSFLKPWLGQMRLSQEEDGSIPIVIPSYPEQTKMQIKTNGWNSSSVWSDACVLLPLCLYKASGDKSLLKDNLPMMEKWLAYIESASTDYIWSGGYHFGDWMIPSYENDIEGGTAVTAPVIAACQYAVTVEAYIQVLGALEENEGRINKAKELLCNIRNAVRERFVDAEGRVEGNLQGLYVMALVSGVCSGELGAKTVKHLAALIEDNGGALDTGFVSTPHLLDVLYDRGYEDLAWKLLFRKESPSWLYQVEKGASSIWENWNAVRPDGTISTSSYNHYSLGSVGSFIYRKIGGLCSKAPGWAEIDYAPCIDCGLEGAKCAFQSPWGLASCSWEKKDGKLLVDVKVPYGVKARLRLPGLELSLTPGDHSFSLQS